jgi:hypothetical protein
MDDTMADDECDIDDLIAEDQQALRDAEGGLGLQAGEGPQPDEDSAPEDYPSEADVGDDVRLRESGAPTWHDFVEEYRELAREDGPSSGDAGPSSSVSRQGDAGRATEETADRPQTRFVSRQWWPVLSWTRRTERCKLGSR